MRGSREVRATCLLSRLPPLCEDLCDATLDGETARFAPLGTPLRHALLTRPVAVPVCVRKPEVAQKPLPVRVPLELTVGGGVRAVGEVVG